MVKQLTMKELVNMVLVELDYSLDKDKLNFLIERLDRSCQPYDFADIKYIILEIMNESNFYYALKEFDLISKDEYQKFIKEEESKHGNQ